MIKRAICAVLCLIMCLSIVAFLPMTAGAADMQVSDACVELIKQLEGFAAIPKWDYSQWTVGFGTTCPEEHLERYKKTGIPISEAEQLLAEKLVYFDECVNQFINKNNLKLTQGQYDAIFSLTYNCGAGWLKKSEGQLYQAIVNGTLGNEFIGALTAWCTAGGNFLHGLMMRRLAETEMYLNGKYNTVVPDYYCYVKFNANGGQRSAAGQGYDSRYAAPVMPTATYTGYRFLGWFTEPNGGTQVTNLDKSHDRITLYAHWEKGEGAPAPAEGVTVTVTTNTLNVRSGAGTGYDVVAQVNSGDQLKITETVTAGDQLWGRCELGWICLDYTDYELVISGGNAGSKIMATITAGSVNVRSGPGASYSRVATLHSGDRVEILEQRTVDGRIWGRYADGWFRISGYATLETTEGGSGGSADNQNPGNPPVGPTGPGTPPVNNPNPTYPKAEVEVPKAPNKVLILGSSAVAIRVGPHKSYPEAGQYPVESRIEALEFMYFMGDVWARTEKGWFCMTRDTVLCDNTVLNNSFVVTIQIKSLYVRSGPSTEYSYVRTVKRDAQLEIYALKETDDGVWGRIYCGWINLKHTDFDASKIPDQTPKPDCNTAGHSYVSTVKQPSCTEGGYTTYVCEKCSHSYTDAETAPLGHRYAATVISPTCTAKGYTTYVCGNCGHTYSDAEIAPLGHSYNAVVTAPTCGKAGYTTHTCTGCGHSYTDTETSALEHSYTSVVTPPTTKEQGYTTHTCGNCGHSYVDSYTDPVKNTVTVTVTKTYATITGSSVYVRKGPGTGYGVTTTIRRGARVEILEQKTIGTRLWGRYEGGWFRISGYATLETVTETYEVEVEQCQHTYTDTVTAPTCDQKGFTTHVCSKCGHNYKDSETAALGHKYTSVVTPPTASAQGYTTHTCANCGHSYKDSYTDPEKEPVTETVTKVYATITAGAVNVRKGAGASFGAVTMLRRGARVEILEQKDVDGRIWGRCDKGWFRLSGYATLETVTEEVEGSKPQQPSEPEQPAEPEKPSEPEQPTEPEKPETTKKTYATITAGAVNVRDGAGASNKWVCVLHKGDKVEIYEQKDVDGRIWGRCDQGWFRLSGGYAKLETVEN